MRRRKGTDQCGWNRAEDAFMRRGARNDDGVRRLPAWKQPAVVRKNSVRAAQGRLSGFLYQAILVM